MSINRPIVFVVALICAMIAVDSALGQWAIPFERGGRPSMTREALERFITMCDLDADQAQRAEQRLETYHQTFDAFHAAVKEEEAELREAYYDKYPVASAEFAQGTLKRTRAMTKRAEDQAEMEAALRRDWRDLLRDDQVPQYERFLRWHRRTTWLVRGASFADERFDLVALIEELDFDIDDVVDDAGRRPLRILLEEYAREIDVPLRELYRLARYYNRNTWKENMRRWAGQFGEDVIGKPPPVADNEVSIFDAFRRKYDQRRRIVTINRTYHEFVQQWIPAEHFDAYLDRHRRQRAGSLLDGTLAAGEQWQAHVTALDDLDDAQTQAITRLWQDFDGRRWRLIDRILELRDAYHTSRLQGRRDSAERNDAQREVIHDLYRLNGRFMEDVADVLTDAQLARVPKVRYYVPPDAPPESPADPPGGHYRVPGEKPE